MFRIAVLIATLITTASFAFHAEAAGMGTFYSSPFFRNQGRQPAEPSPKMKTDRNRLEAADRARARRAAEIRAERAAAQAEAAAAAKRARLAAAAAQQKAAAAAEQKAAAAAEQQKAPVKEASRLPQQPTSAENSAAPKGDLLAVAPQSTSPTRTTAQDKTADAVTPEVCRQYSPTTAGLIEVPCR